MRKAGRSLSFKVPGVSFLVFLGDEEPDEVGVAKPSLLIHPPVPGERNDGVRSSSGGGGGDTAIFVNSLTFPPYLVTVPENILSIILCEMAGKVHSRGYNPVWERSTSFLS